MHALSSFTSIIIHRRYNNSRVRTAQGSEMLACVEDTLCFNVFLFCWTSHFAADWSLRSLREEQTLRLVIS